ncbi:Transcriptional regulator of nonfermentable carbon utilization [Vanrija albida]|uniref:Transcriptional regulator of nonfermentable carbon utilization n=1 Tax=Vanrija albida TaxID=181172 RepID=A0ABR3Q3T8_9TREE
MAMFKYLQEDTGRTQSKKTKCQRACKFCRKSHTTCEDTRPCQRCIKRDIANLCLADEAEQLAEQAEQQAQRASLSGPSNLPDGINRRPSIPVKRRTSYGRPGGEDDGPAHKAHAGGSGRTPSPSSNPSNPSLSGSGRIGVVPLPPAMMPPGSEGFRPMSFDDGTGVAPVPGGPQGWYESPFQGMQKLPDMGTSPTSNSAQTPELTWSALVEGMLHNQHPGAAAAAAAAAGFPPGVGPQTPGFSSWLEANSPAGVRGAVPVPNGGRIPNGGVDFQGQPLDFGNPALGSAGVASSPSHPDFRATPSSLSPGDVLDTTTIVPYNYTYAYSRLRTWANEQSDPSIQARVANATNNFKTVLHGMLSQLGDEQIVAIEAQFLTYVRGWLSTADMIPTPALVFRRTGEITGANQRMSRLLELAPTQLRTGKVTIYHVLDASSFTRYWEEYGTQVLQNMVDRSTFDITLPIALLRSGSPELTHIMSSQVVFDSFGLPMIVTAVFTPISLPPRDPPAPAVDVPVN